MRRIIILWLFLAGTASAWSQPCGLEDTLYINPNSTLTFNFEVFNIYNDDLSAPDQGICGIEIEFSHNYVEDMVLSVTSPAGQTVTLTGPNSDDPVAFTNITRWRITFVPDAVTPMPDFGFLPTWDNNQPNNWGVFGLYTGSYHPYQGRLEDFNTGTVNGSWTIRAINNPSSQIGAILGFRLIFCDERGLDCCFAAAGNLDLYEDILTCEGDTSLALDLPPNYSGTPPDTNAYGYTYLIGEGDILLDYDSVVDLTAFDPGIYQVCGLSYKRIDYDSFPAPNSVLTIDSLRRNLNGLEPIFCGEATDSCLWVRIVAPPDTTFLANSICQGDSVMVGDSVLTTSGSYDIGLLNYAGCDSIVHYDLNVIPIEFTDLVDTICQGDSVWVGAMAYTISGSSVDTLQASTSCDSIVSLNLTVIPPIIVDTTVVRCLGEQFAVGDSILTASGNYSITIPSAQGCDSMVNVTLQILEVIAVIAPPDTINCSDPVVMLNGDASSPAGSVSYAWLDVDGAILGNGATLEVSVSGIYMLEVAQSQNAVQCVSRDTVEVIADTIPPLADAGPADTLTCEIDQLSIGGPGTSTGPEFQYAWSSTGGNFIGGTTADTAVVDAAGLYQLIVTNTRNGCRDTATVEIAVDEQSPIAAVSPDSTLTCTRTSLELSGTGSSVGPAFEYDWQATNGTVPQNANSLSPTVTVAGSYRLLVTNTDNGCVDSATVAITYDTLSPMVTIAEPGELNCASTTRQLDALILDAGPRPLLTWQASNGGNIANGADGLTPEVDAPGTFQLIAENARNGCRDSASVVVVENVNVVVANAGGGGELTCTQDTLALNGSASTMAPDILYCWSSPDGHFVSASLGAMVGVDAPGTYQLIVKDTITFCADTATAIITQDTMSPIANSGPDRMLNCDSTSITLDGSGSSSGGDFDYDWIAVVGVDPIGAGTLFPTVADPGIYLLVVADTDNGCIDTSLVEVSIDTLPPTVDIAEPGILNCAIPSFTLDATASDEGPGFSFYWNVLSGGQIASGDNTLTPLVDAQGRYELVVVNENTGCRDSLSVLVRDSSVPVSALIGPADTLTCDSTQITLNGSASSTGPNIIYDWSTTDGTITGDTDEPSARVSASGVYQLIVLDTLTFCADTAAVFVPLDRQAPAITVQVNSELNCSVTDVVLDGTVSDTGPNFFYTWSGPCVISGQDSLIGRADCPGTYQFQVQNANNGCTAIDSVEVIQNEGIPVANVAGPYRLTCDSLQLTLDGSGSSQGVAFTYEWIGPGLTSGANSLNPAVNLPGQYTLTVRDTVNTCLATATANVSIDTVAPVAAAGEIDILTCDSTVVEIGGFESAMGPGFSYSWTTTANGQFAGPADGPYVLVSEPGIYELTVRNTMNGCFSTSSTTVFEDNDPPGVNAGSNRELNCATPQVLLDGSASDSGAFLQYEWSGPCLLSPTDTSRMLVDCSGVYYLSVTNAASGCVGVDSVVVTRDTLLPIAVLPDTLELSCLDGTATIDASASLGASFQWYLEGQAVNFNTLTPVVDTAGQYTLVATNANQDCADTASVFVLLDCTPDALIAAPDTLTCRITSVLLDATSSTIGDSITYQWTQPGPSCIISGQGTPLLEVRCPGGYTLIITNTVVGLSDTTSVTVIINDTPPVADAGPSDTLTCDEPTATLNASGSTQGAGIGYQWTKLDDEFFNVSGLTATVNDDGTYFLTVIDSLTGCVDEDIVVIERSADLPDIGFGSRVIPCLQDSFWLQAFVEPPGQPYAYTWSGDNIIGAADSSSVLVDTSGMLTLTVVNTANSCTTFRNIEVTEQSCIPCIEIGPVDSLTCLVDTVAITASFCELCIGCTVQWSTQDGFILSNNDSLRVQVGAPGLYTITATDTLGFSEVVSVNIRENTILPVASAGPGQELDCDTPEVSLGGTLANPRYAYQWLEEDGSPRSQDTLPFLTLSTPGTYQLQVTDRITGCSATDQVVVTVETLPPFADAGAPVTLTCGMPSRALDGSASDFGPNITYSWSGPADAVIGGANSFNPIVSDTGWFVLTVTDTTSGCSAQDSVLVGRQGELPPVPLLSDTNFTCGVSVILLIGELPSEPGFTGQWCRIGPDGQPQGPCTNSLFVDVAVPGIYRFEVENDSNGCTNFVDVEIGEDYTPPIANAGPDGILLCTLDSLELQGGGGPAGAPLSYEWAALGGSIIDGASSPTPVIFQPDTFLLTVTNLANQCTASDTVVIGQDINAPTADAGPDTTLSCSQVNVRLQGQGTTASGNIQVNWTTSDGNIALAPNSLTPLIDAPGNYILRVTDPSNGCFRTDTLMVSADQAPPVAALDSSTLQLDCQTDSVFLDAGASASATGAGLDYDWRRLPFGSIGNMPQIVLSSAGNYRLVVTDLNNGCKDTLAFSVGADYELPDAAIVPPLTITCAQPTVLLDGTGSSSGPDFSYIWTSPLGDTLAESGPQAMATLPGVYQLIVTDDRNGCAALAQRSVGADTLPPVANIRAPEPLDCIVRTVELDGSASSFGDFIQYAWRTESGQLAGAVDSSRTLATAPGWYVLQVTDLRNGCTAVDSVQAIELASPIDTLLATAFPPSCPGRNDGYILIDTVLGGAAPFVFAIEGGSLSNLTRFENLSPGTYQLMVEDANGCELETAIDIPEAQTLSVNLGPDITLALGQPDTLIAEITPATYDTIWWWPVDSSSLSNSPIQAINPEKTTTYFVWVSTGEGCTATDNIEVRVAREYAAYAPTAFSPNDDENNDRFTLYAGADVTHIKRLQIFDRWGNLVYENANFQPNDPSLGWDGTLDGMPMDPAVFVFYAEVVFADGRTEVMSGDLVLMR